MAHTIVTETCEGYAIASMPVLWLAFIPVQLKNIKGF